MKVASFFAGVGGIDLAFELAGFNVVWANEIDENASRTYRANFHSELLTEDIHRVEAASIPDFDVMVGGFPCQAFSVAGYRKGFEDDRGNLFFELERIFKKRKPEIIFLENVKNLTSHDHGNTFRVILKHLKEAGYHVKEKVLNACDYGNLPQNRERIYIVAFRSRAVCKEFEFPEPVELTSKLADFIDFETEQDSRLYYTAEKCPFYRELEKCIKSEDTLYQWRRVYVRENKNNMCPTLTANMGTGGHNVPLVKTKFGIRKLSPRECFNLMGYPADYCLPDMAFSHLYKQAGNSVVIPVIRRIAEEILRAVHRVQKSKLGASSSSPCNSSRKSSKTGNVPLSA